MADRLTQLQDVINTQAENFCNAIGVLQQFAPPSTFPELEKATSSKSGQPAGGSLPNGTHEDYAALFAQMIAKTAKDIDMLIESLPGEESSPEFQINALRLHETRNQEAAEKLDESIKRSEKLLDDIQKALHDIGEAQLKMRCLQT